MTEIFMCADSSNSWFKRCSEYCEESEQFWNDINKFFADRGFSEDDFAYDHSPTLYLLADRFPEYKKYAKNEKIIIEGKQFFVIKKTAPLHKEFKASNIIPPSTILTVLELFKFDWEYVSSSLTFILDDKIYVRFRSKKEDVKLPEGFTQLKMQEFYDIKDKYDAGELKLKIIK